MPSLSIIIPVYNVEAYLSKCLDSILVDSAFTGQVICVNDGSTDGSLEILNQYAEKYSNIEIISQQNAGLSVARNVGFYRATGDYVFFVDSDDWIVSDSIDRIMKQVNKEDVLYFNAKIFLQDKHCYQDNKDIPELSNLNGQSYLAAIYDKPRNMPYVCVWGGIYRRLFLIENKLYNEPNLYHEDNYFTPQVLLKAKRVSSINEYVYVYRIHDGSITSRVTEKHIQDILYILRGLYNIYETKGDVVDVFYKDIFNIYVDLIERVYTNELSLSRYWSKADGRAMLRGAYSPYNQKIAKLTYVSPRLAYLYMTNTLPLIVRKLVNRIL